MSHREANQRAKQRLAKRIENKRLYEHDLADPTYYNNIELELRQTFPKFEIDVAPDRTEIRWEGEDGNKNLVRDDTRPGALLKVWRLGKPPEF